MAPQIEFMYHYTVKSLKFRHLSETLFAQESVDKIRLRTLRAEDFRARLYEVKVPRSNRDMMTEGAKLQI